MSPTKSGILYFIAAALFVIAATLSTVGDGMSIKTGFGLLMAVAMVWLGMKERGGSAA